KSSRLRRSRHSLCSIPPILRSTLSSAVNPSSRSPFTDLPESSCSTTLTFHSLSTATAGELDRTGRLLGRVSHRALPLVTRIFLLSSPALLRFARWKRVVWCILLLRRTSGCCTRALER